MRHRVGGRQLGRNTSHRKALFRTLVTAVMDKERIETTIAKAKEIRPMVEKMITLGKKGDLSSRRTAASFIINKDVVKKLFDAIAPRFKDRNGGYTRIIRTRRRAGDGSEMALIELLGTVSEKGPEEVKEEKKKGLLKRAKAVKKPEPEKVAKKEKKAVSKGKGAKKKPDEKKSEVKPKKKTKKKAEEK